MKNISKLRNIYRWKNIVIDFQFNGKVQKEIWLEINLWFEIDWIFKYCAIYVIQAWEKDKKEICIVIWLLYAN